MNAHSQMLCVVYSHECPLHMIEVVDGHDPPVPLKGRACLGDIRAHTGVDFTKRDGAHRGLERMLIGAEYFSSRGWPWSWAVTVWQDGMAASIQPRWQSKGRHTLSRMSSRLKIKTKTKFVMGRAGGV